MEELKNFVQNNSYPLFRTAIDNPLRAVFDNRGFHLSPQATEQYALIQHQPHLYVAHTQNVVGYYYVGESYQTRGRWQRSNYYHLGILARQLLETIPVTPNYQGWINSWMDIQQKHLDLEGPNHWVMLKETVYISFIPFYLYSEVAFGDLTKAEIKAINVNKEHSLIQSYMDDGFQMLNIHL